MNVLPSLSLRLVLALACAVFMFSGTLPSLAQPNITTQPVDKLNVETNSSITFTVEATSSDGGPLFYQWRRNGIRLLGKTDATLGIDKVEPEDCGLYSVLVADTKGITKSRGARLSVNVPLIPSDSNDGFSQRVNLGVGEPNSIYSGYVRTDNRLATNETNEPLHAGKTGGKSVWFKWTAPDDGIVTFSTRGSGFDTLLAAYDDALQMTSLRPAEGLYSEASDDDEGGFFNSEITFRTFRGNTYAIAVDGLRGATGDIMFHWQMEPTNDGFPQIFHASPSRTVGYGESNVTFSVGYSANGTGAIGRWHRDGAPTAVTENSYSIPIADETQVGRYHVLIQSSLNPLRKVKTRTAELQINMADGGSNPNLAALDKFSELAPAVAGPSGASGSGKIPRSNAGTARSYNTTQIFTTVGSTKEEDEPNHCGEPGGASEWYSYQPPENGMMYVNTDGSSYNTVLAAYTADGYDLTTLVPVNCNNGSGNGGDRMWIANASSNTIYFLAVDGVGGASGTVQLNINLGEAPAITAQPTNKTVGIGSNATFTATGTGSPPLFYQWRFNGVNIANATNSTYTRVGCQTNHAGNYRVTVSNLVNIVVTSSVATLTVLTQPSITVQPTDRTVTAGSNTTFSVTAAGSPPLRYQWRFNTTNAIPNATNATFTLTNVQPVNAGTYSVRVTNAVGALTSSNAVLTVNQVPAITIQPATQTVAPGSNVTLTVTATGNPTPKYQWQFNTANISSATNSAYTVSNFQTGNEGNYRVVVSNVVGSVTSSNALLLANSPLRADTFSRGTNGTFHLRIVGLAGTNYVLEASSDLTVWIPLVTNNSPNGLLDLIDTNAAGFSNRFYRAKQP